MEYGRHICPCDFFHAFIAWPISGLNWSRPKCWFTASVRRCIPYVLNPYSIAFRCYSKHFSAHARNIHADSTHTPCTFPARSPPQLDANILPRFLAAETTHKRHTSGISVGPRQVKKSTGYASSIYIPYIFHTYSIHIPYILHT